MFHYLISAIVIGCIFKKFLKYLNIDKIAATHLCIPKIRNAFNNKIKPAKYIISKPKYFFKDVPLNGLNVAECFDLIQTYSRSIRSSVKTSLHSGTIYVDISDTDDYNYLPQNIEGLYMYIMQQSYYWNNMHDVEFRLTYSIQRQLGWMVADILGGSIKPFTSMHTNGGTQSIRTAARAYMNYGRKVKGLKRKDVTIIALDTIHASLFKAQEAFGFNLVIIPTVTGWQFPQDIRKTIDKYKNTVVAIFCSYPAYVYGKIDNLDLFSKIAVEYNIGLHIDCCLGGFIFNQIRGYENAILNTPGLTSLSIDPHKNGMSPKGSSILFCYNYGINNKNLAHYAIYAIPDWKGGLYGSINDEGSSSFVEVFCTYITLLHNGKNKYRENAKKINETCRTIVDIINNHCHKVIDITPLNVVCFKLHPTNNNISYHFASEMEKLGIKLTIISDGYLQFCVTPAFVSNEKNLDRFCNSFIKTINEMGNVDPTNKSVRLYSSVDIALNSSSNNFLDYYQNKLFGKMALEESIREHFMGLLNIEHTEPLDSHLTCKSS